MSEPKSNNADEIEMRYTLTERLKELINETGGDKNFAEKLNEINPESTTDIKLLKRWTDPKKDIQIKNVYLIAMACNVSVDWLLGLSTEKYREEKGFKRLATYGDVLSFLNNLFKIGIISIADTSHRLLDESICVDNCDLILPRYIQINDTHLIELIQDIYKTKELSTEQSKDAWERTLKLEMNNPIQQCDDNPNHNGMRSEQANINKTTVPAKVLNDDVLKAQVKEHLKILKNGLSDEKFGEKIGVSQSTAFGWFTGILPQTYNLYKIAKKYDVHADWILGLDEACDTTTLCKDYGNVLFTLMHLIKKGTIGFVKEYFPFFDYPDDCENNNNAPVVDDLLIIDDRFLFCLLLQQNILEQYSTATFKEMSEELFNKYKDYLLLSFKENMRNDSCKIIDKLWYGNIKQNIDFDKLYEDLQRLSDSKSDK